MAEIKYRGYLIERWPPPIPDRSHDWQWRHEDYDGAPWEHGGPPLDHRAGTSPSLEQAKADIDEQIMEGSSARGNRGCTGSVRGFD